MKILNKIFKKNRIRKADKVEKVEIKCVHISYPFGYTGRKRRVGLEEFIVFNKSDNTKIVEGDIVEIFEDMFIQSYVDYNIMKYCYLHIGKTILEKHSLYNSFSSELAIYSPMFGEITMDWSKQVDLKELLERPPIIEIVNTAIAEGLYYEAQEGGLYKINTMDEAIEVWDAFEKRRLANYENKLIKNIKMDITKKLKHYMDEETIGYVFRRYFMENKSFKNVCNFNDFLSNMQTMPLSKENSIVLIFEELNNYIRRK